MRISMKMKLLMLIIILPALIYALSCNKSSPGYYSCTGPAAYQDSSTLLTYARDSGITATMDTSFLFYQIIDSGTVPHPNLNSLITVNYVSRIVNTGVLVDSADSASFHLDSLILGWQYGLQKIGKGGQIKLLVPSALAFGCSGSGNVQPNEPLYFEVTLLNFQ
jgi:FKBP-type peptidyl-prolyl cis-trans isomerase FkpA